MQDAPHYQKAKRGNPSTMRIMSSLVPWRRKLPNDIRRFFVIILLNEN